MDPNACLIDALDAMANGDGPAAVVALRDLADWLERGGFTPGIEAGHYRGPGARDYVVS